MRDVLLAAAWGLGVLAAWLLLATALGLGLGALIRHNHR